MCLTVPAKVNATGGAFHMHTSAVLFNAYTALRALTSVVRVLIYPLHHLSTYLAVLMKHTARKFRMCHGMAGGTQGYSTFTARELLAVGTRRRSSVDHLAVGCYAAAVAFPVRQHERPNRRVVKALQISSE